MTTAKLREALARVEAATGPSRPLTHEVCSIVRDVWGERYSEVCGLFELAVSGGLDALGAVVALIEREMLGWGHQVGRPLQTYKKGYYASVFREATESEKTAGLWMPGHFSAGREYGADYSESKMQYFPSPALALLAAYLRAKIAEAEQREDVA